MPNDNEKRELTPAQVALRNTAIASRDKKRNKVSSTVVRTMIVNFLNSGDFSTVVDWPNKSAKEGAIVQRLKTIIEEDNLGELVYPVTNDNGVNLVTLS